VSKGTVYQTQPVEGESCTYRSCYDVKLAPIALEDAKLVGQPLPETIARQAPAAIGALKLRFTALAEEASLSKIGRDEIRMFIAAETRLTHKLHELIFNNVVRVIVVNDDDDDEPLVLDADAVRPVGFGQDEGIVPGMAGASHLYRFISEYFAFPEKYYFFDICGLDTKLLRGVGRRMSVYLCFNALPGDIERSVNADNFKLFCTPMTNIFEVECEPMRIDPARDEQRIVPNARRESSMEILRVESVKVTDSNGETTQCTPFFAMAREQSPDNTRFWEARRRPADFSGGGDDVYLSLSLPNDSQSLDDDVVVTVKALCTNRSLPSRLPFGGGQPRLFPQDAMDGLKSVECLTAPTRAIHPKRSRDAYWRLISQLSLNHLSLTGGEEGGAALRELLAVHDTLGAVESRAVVARVKSVSSQRGTARAPDGDHLAFCSGVEVTIGIDDERCSGSGAFLLMMVLDRFFAAYCTINSFSRLRVELWGDKTTLVRFPARAGDLCLT
ncbi:MAG: type VI secretion system baseplate subunit TssF, partial [Pseudomonadota bacterium]